MFNDSVDFKEKMVETRRLQILQGAAQVFAEKGFHKSTTKQIAKAAGVSEGTIYNYFSNKRELLFALIEMIGLESLRGLIQNAPASNPRQFLKNLFHDRYQLIATAGQVIAPIMAEVFADESLREELYEKLAKPLTAHLEEYFQNQIDCGVFRPIDPMIITRAIIGAMALSSAFKLTELEARYSRISPDELVEAMVDLFLDGLLADENYSSDTDSPAS